MTFERQPFVSILASGRNGTLYTGVTSDLIRRVHEHRTHVAQGFSERYSVTELVWFEQHESMASAIIREKRIKKWNRQWKVELIEETNPYWRDLWPEIIGAT